jgi:4-hydroxybenzoate polyprenyltransferase
MLMLQDLLISSRPRQWLKNLLVFAPLLFSRQFVHLDKLLAAVLALAVFCLLSSVVYLINDVIDAKEDRRHEDKRKRPIAAGRLQPAAAMVAAVVFAALALLGAFLASAALGWTAVVYLAAMSAYTLGLKHVVILDVLIIAFGFILRAHAGGVAVSVPVSEWLYLCTLLLSLFLALSKRRHELVLLEEDAPSHRRCLAEYTPYLLDQMIAVVTSSTVMAYALYTLSARTQKEVSTGLYLTLPFVLYGVFRYLYLVHRKEKGGQPEMVLLSDPGLIVDLLLWVVSVALILRYFPGTK